jgi:hypothetical protein
MLRNTVHLRTTAAALLLLGLAACSNGAGLDQKAMIDYEIGRRKALIDYQDSLRRYQENLDRLYEMADLEHEKTMNWIKDLGPSCPTWRTDC